MEELLDEQSKLITKIEKLVDSLFENKIRESPDTQLLYLQFEIMSMYSKILQMRINNYKK